MGPGTRARDAKAEESISSVSGALAGAISAIVVCPLDVLRTRFQVEGQNSKVRYRGLIGGLSQIARDEGVKGLYSGLTPTLFALVPNWAVYFFAYEKLKTSVSGWRGVEHETGNHMISAAGAGLVTVVATNPLWVVKTRLQTQDMGLEVSWPKYKGTFSAISEIARKEGVSALYSGLIPSTLGILHVTIQFPLYEYCKSQLALRGKKQIDELQIPELIAASSTAKMAASMLTYPHEVLRSQMHIKGTGPFGGFLDICQGIYMESGGRGFYKGCAVNLLRTVPAAAVTFTSFELIARYLRNIFLSKD